jgi:hypothetical protein
MKLYRQILLPFKQLCLVYPLLFATSYFAVNFTLLHYLGDSSGGNLILFITAPVNFREALLREYGTFQAGLLQNFVAVFFLVFLAELYQRKFIRTLGPYVSMKAVFGYSVVATYIMSAVFWLGSPPAGTGTSVIGLSMLLFLMIGLGTDGIARLKDYYEGKNGRQKNLMYGLILMIFLILPIYEASTYIFNPSYLAHLIGGVEFLSLIIGHMLVKKISLEQVHPHAKIHLYG